MNTETEEALKLIRENNPSLFSNFIKKNIGIINFDIEDKHNKTLIDYIIRFNNFEILDFILKNKKVNLFRNKNILKYPIKHDLKEIVKSIVNYDKSIVKFNDSKNFNAFGYAVKYDNLEYLKFFHKILSELNKLNFYKNLKINNETFYHFIINNNVEKCFDIFNILGIKNIEDIKNDNNESLLMCFFSNIIKDTEEKNKEIIDKINSLIKNPNFNTQDKINDKTLLHLLFENKYYDSSIYYLNLIDKSKIKLNVNLQDKKGQTIFHVLLRRLIKDDKDKLGKVIENLQILLKISDSLDVNFNIYDMKLKTTVYLNLKIMNIFYKIDRRRNKRLLDALTECGRKIILKSNLNIQDLNFCTSIHIIAKFKLFKIFKDELKIKKINITLKNKEDKRPFDYLTNEEEFNEFFDIYFESYIFYLKKNKFVENEFNKQILKLIKENKKENCKKLILSKIKNNDYEDLNIIKYKLNIKNSGIKNNELSFIYFGSSVDIFFVCKLLKKNKLVYFPHEKNISSKSSFPIIQYYKKNGLIIDNESIIENNFIFWFPKNSSLFINPYLIHKINKKTKKNIIVYIPLLIYLEDKEINHMNMLYFVNDKIYHYDPYGTYNNEKLKINLFGDILSKTLDEKYHYMNPEKYTNKIGLQFLEEEDKSVYYVNDSVNYCVIWCLFFSSIYFDNPNLSFEHIMKYIKINLFKDQVNLKKLIKDNLKDFIKYRNDELEKQEINISDYSNDNLDVEYYYKIVNSFNK